MDEVEFAYLAGLVDGEGSIYVSVNENESVLGYRIRPRFVLGMKQDESTEKVKSLLIQHSEFFDAHYNIRKIKEGYSWKFEIAGDNAVSAFLEPLIQYLEIKRDRAVIVVNNDWKFPRSKRVLTEEEKKEKMVHLMEKREQIRGMSADRDSKYDVATVKEEIYNE